jgi:hypothetical protein
MTAPAVRLASRRSLGSRAQWAGAIASVAGLIALLIIGPPVSASAATTGTDPITGGGNTSSAVTVPWTSGLLDSANKPIAGGVNADRSSATPASPYSFMYADFKNLNVTVSQTEDITHQGITVSWTGGEPSISGGTGPQAGFLQVMECYGDASSGPDPADCEYGSTGLLAPGIPNPYIGQRIGHICTAGATPSVTSPPSSEDGTGPLVGCDPQEPLAGASPPHVEPCTGTGCTTPALFSIPFVPVSDPSSPAYQADLGQYFNEFNTNEIQEAVTNPDGTGQLQFETLTGIQAPGLGCGQLETGGKPRGCWLVIVPRGQYEPNGYKINSAATGVSGYIQSSPLSASNWAQRVQIHLGYAPLIPFCPIGTQEIETVGTQVVARAVQSWQLALNKAANCTKIYGYSAVPEATSTQQLALRGSGIGLAFTTIPIGSEASRPGGGGGSAKLPPMLYAPVAVSAMGFGFNINDGSGYVSTPVKLTPQLLAKGLTQVYRFDLPDYYPSATGHPGPTWSAANPVNMSDDPDFEKLNPEVAPYNSAGISLAPLLTEDHSGLNQQIWQWIRADPAASAWLDSGTLASTNTVAADPDYEKLKLGRAPASDSFPRAYAACLNLGTDPGPPPKEEKRCSLDLLPYVNDYDSAAAAILTATNPTTGQWSDVAIAPDGSTGWWQKTGAEPLGQVFMWGIANTADLAAYGLVDAQLCSDSGSNCVGPSSASVTAALNSAKPDSAGLLQVNPAAVGKGGYPLVNITYAAVPTNQSAKALKGYADLIAYAAGAGQTPGVAPGNLPPGYLSLPASLRAAARAVVAKLRADASGSRSTSPSPSPTGSSTSAGTTTQAAAPSGQITPAAGNASPSEGPSITLPSAELATSTTPRQPVGAIRWALIVVVIAGAACAASGAVLRAGMVSRWLHRRRS